MGGRASNRWALLLAISTLFGVAAAVVEDSNFVQRVRDTYGFYFIIKNFALRNPFTFESVIVPSACRCRRRCQAMPSCRAVSIVPLEGTVAVECRLTERPGQMDDWNGRPQLIKTPGAIHFLGTDEENWTNPEADGLFYSFSEEKDKPGCPQKHHKAIATTSLRYTILKNKLDELKDDRGMYVGLRQLVDGNNSEISWSSKHIPPYESVPYNQTLLPNSILVNTRKGNYHFIMKKEHSQIVFQAAGDMDYKTLCFSNKLKLLWY
ncbi:uncharacterized protein LOC122266707 [Penaeus japonicus]|uniref:uncharacterized protein LOC122266707 n=1 Tax=Penaeus japonicus TaxID=27405 RepID=UPI001C71790E|nr:uncharacterized protein LOC122266707 [Penaeus japonicus]